jgi:hypothetical protein
MTPCVDKTYGAESGSCLDTLYTKYTISPVHPGREPPLTPQAQIPGFHPENMWSKIWNSIPGSWHSIKCRFAYTMPEWEPDTRSPQPTEKPQVSSLPDTEYNDRRASETVTCIQTLGKDDTTPRSKQPARCSLLDWLFIHRICSIRGGFSLRRFLCTPRM